jgi:hypothetical protein
MQPEQRPTDTIGLSERSDLAYQRFHNNACACAPIVAAILPTSARVPSIDATSSGLIVDEFNAPNSGDKWS